MGIACYPGTPLSLEDAQRLIARYVEHYNSVRLHSAIGYAHPQRQTSKAEKKLIFAERDRKLEQARERRKEKRHAARQAAVLANPPTHPGIKRPSSSLNQANVSKAFFQFRLNQYTVPPACPRSRSLETLR